MKNTCCSKRSENLSLNKIKKEIIVRQTAIFYGEIERTDQLIFILFIVRKIFLCQSQLPRGLRRRSSASRLLRLWVRIPPGAWMFVFCQVEISTTD